MGELSKSLNTTNSEVVVNKRNKLKNEEAPIQKMLFQTQKEKKDDQ